MLDKMQCYGAHNIRGNILRYRKWIKRLSDDIIQTSSVPVISNETKTSNQLINIIHNQTHPGNIEPIRRLKNVFWWR